MCLFQGPVPAVVLAGTTHALVPVLTDAALGADLAAGADEGAIAGPPCQIGADTLATGYVLVLYGSCRAMHGVVLFVIYQKLVKSI